MACILRKDAANLFDAVGSLGQTPAVFIKSDASVTATATNATLNGAAVAVGADGKATLPALQRGTNVLVLVIVGAQPGDDIQLAEDCGAGQTQVLARKFLGAAPGGANPTVGFRIHAS